VDNGAIPVKHWKLTRKKLAQSTEISRLTGACKPLPWHFFERNFRKIGKVNIFWRNVLGAGLKNLKNRLEMRIFITGCVFIVTICSVARKPAKPHNSHNK
jgi:hypothetical protein